MMTFQEAFKYLLSPLQCTPPMKKAFSGEKPRVSGFLPSWQVKTFKKQDKCFPLSQIQFFKSVLQPYAKFSLAGNTRLFQAHAVLVLCIYLELCSSAAPPNPHCSQQPSCCCWGALGVTMLCNPDFTSQRPQGETCATDSAKGKFSTGRLPS